MKESLIKPIHGMCYIGRISVDYHMASRQFFDLFNKFFIRKTEGRVVEVAYFEVSKFTDKQLEYLEKTNFALFRYIKTSGVTDFAVIDGKYFIKNFSACELGEDGLLFIDMNRLDPEDRDYGYFAFYLNVNFIWPWKEANL